MYKLRTLPKSDQVNLFMISNNDHRSKLQTNFTCLLTIAATIPSTLILLLNTCLAKKYEI